ncbi:MAG: hypothetical protein SH868_07375 [Bythopirellula sp.]|nr:hypothetical protein [Bythopirellula sp.]
MPVYVPERLGWRAGILLSAYLVFASGLLMWAVWEQPWIIAALVVIVAVVAVYEKYRRYRYARQRVGESLCTFARSFDYRLIDTWIIRAVYEQVQPLVEFPIRKTDRIHAELDLDGELDEIGEEIAFRTGRDFTNTKQNPWYAKIETLEDLVAFFMCQPQVNKT